MKILKRNRNAILPVPPVPVRLLTESSSVLAVGDGQRRRQPVNSHSVVDVMGNRGSKLGHFLRQLSSGGVVMSADERIGKYRVVKVLAQSANGDVVCLGFDEDLQRQVAIKVSNNLAAPEEIEDFPVGAASLVKLDHPHIEPIYDVGRTEEGKHYIVCKFIDGATLREKIQNERPSYDESATLLATIAETLHFAHEHCVMHGNLNPGNILIEKATEAVYVTDFVVVNRAGSDELDNVVGNPSYMSPEQIRGERHLLDGRTDIFSLGVIFYELLTGVRPFRGTASELLNQILSVKPVPPRKMNGAVPVELDRICLKALAKQASDRYSTAGKLADDLRQFRTDSKWWWLPRFRRR